MQNHQQTDRLVQSDADLRNGYRRRPLPFHRFYHPGVGTQVTLTPYQKDWNARPKMADFGDPLFAQLVPVFKNGVPQSHHTFS